MISIIHCLLSNICITIPEHIFLVIITLRLLGRKEMLDFAYNLKENLISILKIIIPSALTLDILNYIIKTPSNINTPISLIILYLLLIHKIKKRSFIEYPKLYQKTFGFFILSILISLAIETITYPIVLTLINKSYQEISKNLYLIIICSISCRIIDLLILAYIFIKKNSKIQINISDYIFKNKFFMYLTLFLSFGLIIFETYILKLILWNNFLTIVNTLYEQMFIVIGSFFLIPGILIMMVYACLNYCLIIINSEKQIIQKN